MKMLRNILRNKKKERGYLARINGRGLPVRAGRMPAAHNAGWKPALLVLFVVFSATIVLSQNEDNIVKLDLYGERGVVYFDHRSHEMLVSPDPNWPFKAQHSAACSGCHHSTNSKGILQLVACRACHLEEGNAKNPKSSRDMTEITTDEAFHRNCISCHRAAMKGPRLCSGCHKMVETP